MNKIIDISDIISKMFDEGELLGEVNILFRHNTGEPLAEQYKKMQFDDLGEKIKKPKFDKILKKNMEMIAKFKLDIVNKFKLNHKEIFDKISAKKEKYSLEIASIQDSEKTESKNISNLELKKNTIKDDISALKAFIDGIDREETVTYWEKEIVPKKNIFSGLILKKKKTISYVGKEFVSAKFYVTVDDKYEEILQNNKFFNVIENDPNKGVCTVQYCPWKNSCVKIVIIGKKHLLDENQKKEEKAKIDICYMTEAVEKIDKLIGDIKEKLGASRKDKAALQGKIDNIETKELFFENKIKNNEPSSDEIESITEECVCEYFNELADKLD